MSCSVVGCTSVRTHTQVSAIISSACYSSWFLLAGFVVPRPVCPYLFAGLFAIIHDGWHDGSL